MLVGPTTVPLWIISLERLLGTEAPVMMPEGIDFFLVLCPVTHLGSQQTMTDNLVHQALGMRKLINAHDCLLVPWLFAKMTASLRTPIIGQFLNFKHV